MEEIEEKEGKKERDEERDEGKKKERGTEGQRREGVDVRDIHERILNTMESGRGSICRSSVFLISIYVPAAPLCGIERVLVKGQHGACDHVRPGPTTEALHVSIGCGICMHGLQRRS